MILDLISQNPYFIIAWIAAILVAMTGHEFSHALMAHWQGDDTAERMGRLTLNPLAHIDPLGFLALIFIGFGWGKPVPFDPNQLRNPKSGAALVGMAGPISNLIMATVFGVILKIVLVFTALDLNNLLVVFLILLVQINLMLMLFNLIPLPPLDGSKLLFALLPPSLFEVQKFLERYGPIILIAFVVLDTFLPTPILGGLFGWVFDQVNRLF